MIVIRIMIHFLLRILGNSLALFAATLLVNGFILNGGIKEFLLAGIILGLMNLIVRPILKLISMPVIILTLGVFSLVINALMLWAVDYLFEFVIINNLYALVWATIVVTAVNAVISLINKATK